MLLRTIEDACGDDPGSVCEWVYDRTDGNETLAGIADWLVGRPLEVLFVIVLTTVGARLARRWVRRVVHRVVVDESIATRQLRRFGVAAPAILAEVRDPRREIRAAAIATVVGSAVTVAIWTLATISVLGTLGIDLGPLLAGAGVAGIALGFGAQSLVRDWITGIFMLLEDQFGIGDVVDVAEASGTVEELTLRTTVLRGADGTVWHVPNGEIRRVGNKSQLWSVAVVDVLVAHDSDIPRARELLLDAAEDACGRDELAERVLEPPQVLGIESVTAEGITLRLTVKTTPGSQWELQRAIREAVKAAFDRGGIRVPAPMGPVWARSQGAGPQPSQPGRGEPGSSTQQPSDDPA